AVVEAVFIGLRIRWGRLIGIVGIVEVDPDEMRAGGMRVEPRLRMFYHFGAAALDSIPAGFVRGSLGKVIVEIEAAIESGSESLAVENNRADKCSGVIALGL